VERHAGSDMRRSAAAAAAAAAPPCHDHTSPVIVECDTGDSGAVSSALCLGGGVVPAET